MRDRGRLVLEEIAAHRRRSAALWTALFSLAAALGVFLPWARWDPGDGSWHGGGPREFSDEIDTVMGVFFGAVDGAASHFWGRYSAVLAVVAVVVATSLAGARTEPGVRSVRRRAGIALAAVLGAMTLTAADLTLDHGSDLTPRDPPPGTEGWRRGVGPWVTLAFATAAAAGLVLLLARTRAPDAPSGGPIARTEGAAPRRAAVVASLCGLAVGFGVPLPWYGLAGSAAEQRGDWASGWSGFGFLPLGLATFVGGLLGWAPTTRQSHAAQPIGFKTSRPTPLIAVRAITTPNSWNIHQVKVARGGRS